MPQKVRELIAQLENAGFVNKGGKGSHRKFVHPDAALPIVISGNPGSDARKYQERAVAQALKEVRKK
jgi:predicted RNA binding protein YcfA (HicA-like mRNA interferase family)